MEIHNLSSITALFRIIRTPEHIAAWKAVYPTEKELFEAIKNACVDVITDLYNEAFNTLTTVHGAL